MMEGLSSRAYESDTICKGGHELMPGERPRAPYRHKDVTDHCPKCGAKTGYVHTQTYFGCKMCGTHLYAEIIPKMPLTPEMKRQFAFVQNGGNPLVDAVCETCGKKYRTIASQPDPLCQKCRQARYRRNYKARLKRLATTPTGDKRGVTDATERRKEDGQQR